MSHNRSHVFLCKRETNPRAWFWPGSRLYKGKRLESAAHRVPREKLRVQVTVEVRLEVYEHFWKAYENREGVSRHTINITYCVSSRNMVFTIDLDEQDPDDPFVCYRNRTTRVRLRALPEYELV